MKITIDIPDDVYEENTKEIEHLVSSLDETLGVIDERIKFLYEEGNSYEEDMLSDFISDELEGVTDYKVLKGGILEEISKKLRDDAMAGSGRSKLSGSFSTVETIAGVKYKDPDTDAWTIRVFARIKTGIAEETGKSCEEWTTSSIWTPEGEFIEVYG